MTDREIVGLMAALLWPYVDADGTTPARNPMAVQHARELLAEVDAVGPAESRPAVVVTECALCRSGIFDGRPLHRPGCPDAVVSA